MSYSLWCWKPWPKPRTESRWNPRIPCGSEFDREFFRIGSRSGAAGRSIRAALSVRCGKLLEFGAGLGQGIFYHLRREFFRADTEFVGRVEKWASASRPINRSQ